MSASFLLMGPTLNEFGVEKLQEGTGNSGTLEIMVHFPGHSLSEAAGLQENLCIWLSTTSNINGVKVNFEEM